MAVTVECARCRKSVYLNEITIVPTSTGNVKLCQQCYGAMDSDLSEKEFLSRVIRSTMTAHELMQIEAERCVARILEGV